MRPEDGDKWPLGIADCFTEKLQLFLDQHTNHPRLARHRLRHTKGARMLAMGRAKGVIDINIAEPGQLFGEVGIVLLFFLMEAEIFQQKNITVFQLSGEFVDFRADAVRRERHRLVQQFGQSAGGRLERIPRLRAAFGTAEMAHENEAAAAIQDAFNRRKRLGNAAVIGDPRTVQRDIKIDPHQNFFAFYVNVGDCFFGHVIFLDWARSWPVGGC